MGGGQHGLKATAQAPGGDRKARTSHEKASSPTRWSDWDHSRTCHRWALGPRWSSLLQQPLNPPRSFFYSFIHSFLHSFIHSLLHSFIHEFFHATHSLIRSSIHPLIPPSPHPPIHAPPALAKHFPCVASSWELETGDSDLVPDLKELPDQWED